MLHESDIIVPVQAMAEAASAALESQNASFCDLFAIGRHMAMVHQLAARSGRAGKIVLVGFREGIPPVVHHFAIGDVAGALNAVLANRDAPLNWYCPLAVMRHDLERGAKGREIDVVAVLGLVVDGDADKGRAAPVPPVEADYVLQTSAGNHQHFLLFDRPLVPSEAKPLGVALKRATGADCTDDVSHVWRIAGGQNFPTASKLKRGRPPEPQPVRVVKRWDGSRTSVDELPRVLEPHWEEGKPHERTTTAAALDGYDIGKVAKWIEQKLPKWQEASDPNPWNDQGEWVFFGKALKLHFPNEDGLELLMQVTHSGHDTIERRWWNERDFKPDWYDGARTLKYYLDRDIDWMFGDVIAVAERGEQWVPPPVTPEQAAKFVEDVVARRAPLPVGYASRIVSGDVPKPEWWERYVAAGPIQEDPVAEQGCGAGVSLEDFIAYSPMHKYFYVPTRELWLASSVNSRLPTMTLLDDDGKPVLEEKTDKPVKIPAATWLDRNHAVEQVTWCPGMPMEIHDQLVNDGGWFEKPGACTFNLYKPSTISPRAGDASPWIDHVRRVFPDDADHIIRWLAHRVQRPHEKCNHALVFGGRQGIGKDTILEPVKSAIGAWNFKEVNPKQLLGRFNGFIKSVILRVSEARDLGEIDRYGFYEATKTLAAAPPDTLRVDEKHLPEQAVFNVTGVLITTNNKDGLYIPSDDRRYFVAWSPLSKEDFDPTYWATLYGWFERGGNEIVTHYLATLDISTFDPKAPAPKTLAFWEIVDAGRAPEDAELQDAIDKIQTQQKLDQPPAAVTVDAIMSASGSHEFNNWLRDKKNRRSIPHRFEAIGYVPVRNSDAKDGLWVVVTGKVLDKGGKTVDVKKRQAVYAKADLPLRDQIAAARVLAMGRPPQ